MVVSAGVDLPGSEKGRHKMVSRGIGQHGNRSASLGLGERPVKVEGTSPHFRSCVGPQVQSRRMWLTQLGKPTGAPYPSSVSLRSAHVPCQRQHAAG